MKKLLLSTTALLGLSFGALAADLPSRRAPAPFVAVPVFTWTGFYVGVNAGYGFAGDDDNRGVFGNGFTTILPSGAVADIGGPVVGFANSRSSRDGFIGGGQIGYNYQFGQFVIGLEADIQYADFGGNRNGAFGNNFNGGFFTPTATAIGRGIFFPVNGFGSNVAFFNNNGTFDGRSNIDWFGTVRGRVGFAIDRLLVFGTGGLAFTDSGNNNNNGFGGFGNGGNVPAAFFVNGAAQAAGAAVAGGAFGRVNNNDDIGYAVGGGVEYAFTPNLTAKVEGLYVNFGGSGNRNGGANNVVGVTNTGAPVFQGTFNNSRGDLDFGLVRAGLNYKFNMF